jgi:hypothetical protein
VRSAADTTVQGRLEKQLKDTSRALAKATKGAKQEAARRAREHVRVGDLVYEEEDLEEVDA